MYKYSAVAAGPYAGTVPALPWPLRPRESCSERGVRAKFDLASRAGLNWISVGEGAGAHYYLQLHEGRVRQAAWVPPETLGRLHTVDSDPARAPPP